MSSGSSTIVLKQIDTLFRTGTSVGSTDGELLSRFVVRRDEGAEAAFAVLVDRHGAMVMRTCRQVLGDQHDAEDAAQAVFLVLARQAGTIRRRESVASWLHGVALRVAARVRRAAARRRAHEQKAVEIARDRPEQQEPRAGGLGDDDRWAELHQELDRLPERFRAPLVLLHLEGLTQEQAAAQLRLPVGTLQSRSARGRAQLKARLEKRGASLMIGPLEAGAVALDPSSAPIASAWAEATVKLALQFSQGPSAGILAAGAAAAELARQMLRTILMAKIKTAISLIFLVAAATSGVVAWTLMHQQPAATTAAQPQSGLPAKKLPEIPAAKPEAPQQLIKRTVRGVVRDEQGRPVAKAWIGHGLVPLPDAWNLIEPVDRIRETKVPFRDSSGKTVGPGALGKYFEVRDDAGQWKPVDPAELRRFDPKREEADPFRFPDLPGESTTNPLPAKAGIEVRVRKDRWQLGPNISASRRYPRTDSEGRFESVVSFLTDPKQDDHEMIHFASPDFLQQAVCVIRREDPDQPVEVVLRPVRKFRARLMETPADYPRGDFECRIWATDVPGGAVHSGKSGVSGEVFWGYPRVLEPSEGGAPDDHRRLEVLLIPGRYSARFDSETTVRFVDFEVPSGEGRLPPLLIRVEALACIRMVGKTAAEIDATDVRGRTVRLADYRGKVVVLDFWNHTDRIWMAGVSATLRMKERFKKQPVEFLAIHDASITSLPAYREVIAAMTQEPGVRELPSRMLLDRPPAGKGTGPFQASAGEFGSGVTSDRYEIACWPSTFVIDQEGRMALALAGLHPLTGAYKSYRLTKAGELVVEEQEEPRMGGDDGKYLNRSGMDALERTIENLLRLPRADRAQNSSPGGIVGLKPDGRTQPGKSREQIVLRGVVLGLDGRPIEGAKVSCSDAGGQRVDGATASANGDFSIRVGLEEPRYRFTLKVEAAGLATQLFQLAPDPGGGGFVGVDENGALSRPLILGRGVPVTGRLVRDGKPVGSAAVALDVIRAILSDEVADRWAGARETKSDQRGGFRFEHVLSVRRLVVYAKHGALEDGETIAPVFFTTGADGTAVELGDLEVIRGKTMAGRVVFSDGKRPYQKAQLVISPDPIDDKVSVELDQQGRFRADGLPAGPVSVSFWFFGKEFIESLPAGYQLSLRNRCADPETGRSLEGRLDHDITDLTILFEPDEAPRTRGLIVRNRDVDPAVVADFEDAKAGPITGVAAIP